MLLGLALLTLGSAVQYRELFSGLLITEYLIILLPSLLFVKGKGESIKKTLRLNKIGLRQIILVIGITIFTYPIAVFFQAILLTIINLFREVTPSSVPMPHDGLQYLISFFIIAVSPGICEEVLFRGVMLDTYSKIGYKKSIIITALLFGMFHFNILNFVGPTILGIVFGIMVYKTNSIYSSMIGHTINNGIALTLGFILNKYQGEIDQLAMESSASIESTSFGTTNLIGILFLVFCFFMVKSMLNKLPARENDYDYKNSYYDTKDQESYMEDQYYNKEFEDYVSSRFERIQYFPLVTLVFIFILVNWIFFFI